MAKSVSIKNFRGFQSAELADCRRVNVIVGNNGSGKTALLEAIFLASGASAELPLRIRSWRGIDLGEVRGTATQISETLWGDLFYKFEIQNQATIQLAGGPPTHHRALQIDFEQPKDFKISIGKRSEEGRNRGLESETPIRFRWRLPHDHEVISTAKLEDGKLSISVSSESRIEAVFFSTSATYGSAEVVQRFSYLSKRGKNQEVEKLFQAIFPEIEGISIEMAGGQPMLFAKVLALEAKVPLGLLSSGMTKLASILFAIPSFAKGIVLIDEIDNGFHYSKLPQLWNALALFASQFDAQLFISTHSAECLKAAAGVAKSEPDMFSLIRTERSSDGPCKAKQFSGDQFAAALEFDVDVR